MPLPFLLGSLLANAALNGSVSATNEQAQEIVNDAMCLYDSSKNSLEKAQKRTQDSLIALGTTKKHVLDTSIAQFMTVYNRVKNAELDDANGLNELKIFMIDEQGVLQLREMSDIYESALSGSAGAGVLTSLAVNDALPVGGLSLAPIAVPIPIIVFSGITAKIAVENLEKARAMYAEAEAAAEKMKTEKKLCNAISQKAQMFNDLLLELDKSFSYCTALLDSVTKKKMEFSKDKVDARKLTAEEKVLLATTRALAGAVKNVIFTPILTKDGRAMPSKSTKIYNATAAKLPAFTESVDKIKSINYI